MKRLSFKIIFFFIIIIIVILTIVLNILDNIKTYQATKKSTPSPTSIPRKNIPTSTPPYYPAQSQTRPPIMYQAGSTDRVVDKINNRKILSTQDKNLRDELVKKGDTIFVNNTWTLYYISSLDYFLAEITTDGVAQAKSDVMVWLENQGFTKQGICNLPLIFFINSDISNVLQEQQMIFDPIPEGC